MKELAKEKETDGKARKRGRPKKAIIRSVSLVVRITPTERLAIAGKARSAGMRISDWFRQSAKTAEIRPRLSKSRYVEDYDGHTWEIFYMDMSKLPAEE